MANPEKIVTPADIWTKVATGVTAGTIHKAGTNPNKYLRTYKLTGETAPADSNIGVMAFKNGDPEIISHSVSIDVYIYPIGASGEVIVEI